MTILTVTLTYNKVAINFDILFHCERALSFVIFAEISKSSFFIVVLNSDTINSDIKIT